MTDWLDQLHDAKDRARLVRSCLYDLSRSFQHTGNSSMAQQLRGLAVETDAIHDLVGAGTGTATLEMMRAAEAATLNMITVGLNMAMLGQEQELEQGEETA